MYWNHRVMKRKEHGIESLFIVEVYYNDENNEILGWTESEEVWGEDIDGVLQCLEWMKDACYKPVLVEADLIREAEERGPLSEEDSGVQEVERWEHEGGS